MRINREGYGIITKAGVFILLLTAVLFFIALYTGVSLWYPAVVAAALAVVMWLVVRFFRDPRRDIKCDESIIFAPADGKIVVIEEVFEKEFFHDRMIQVSVFMSVNNIHVNWFPAGGKVIYKKVHDGNYMVAWHPKSSEENERVTTVVETKNGKRIMMRQVAGYLARRIVNYATVNEDVGQNDRLGFIKFGSRVDVYLPLGSDILVGLNQKVTGSQTPLARLPE